MSSKPELLTLSRGDLAPSRCAVLALADKHSDLANAVGLRELERRGYPVFRAQAAADYGLLKAELATEVLSRGFAETLWVDEAIEFDANDVVKIRTYGLPLVAGVCPLERPGLDIELMPGTGRLTLGLGGGPLEVLSAGMGFFHVRREVYETIRSRLKLPECQLRAGQKVTHYFLPTIKEGATGYSYSDGDAAFCQRARQCGYTIIADTSIRLYRSGKYRYSWEDAGGTISRFASYDLRFVSGHKSATGAPTGTNPLSDPEPFQSAELDALRRAYPWPALKPAVPVRTGEGWLFPSTQEILSRFLTPETKLIVELGSWLGLSTRFIASRAPRATVIAIDHWRGSPEHQQDELLRELLPILYETFLANCWDERARVTPLRMGTVEGLERVAAAGLQPDLVYVDADHSYEGVTADLQAIGRLFPQATIVGDDWNWEGVRAAALAFSGATGRPLQALEAGWCVLRG